MNKKEEFMRTNKKYFVPSLLLIIVFIGKLYFADLLEPIYLALKGYSFIIERTVMEWWQIIGLIVMDTLVGVIYAWIKVRNDKEEEYILEDRETIEDEKKEDEDGDKVDEKLGIVERGFNYLWMGGVSNILITVIWSLVLVTLSILFKSVMVIHPNTVITLSMLMGVLQIIITAIVKRGILAYTVYSTYAESNILKALKFTTKNIFRIVLVEIVYLLWVGVGILALGVGVFLTHPKAVEYKTERWSKLVRDYEREELYGTINK